MSVILDTSHWEPDLDPVKLKGIGGIIGRMGTSWHNLNPDGWMDLTFTKHCQIAYDLDIPFGGYWYDDPYWFLDNGWTFGAIEKLEAKDDPRITIIKRALFSGSYMRKVHFIAVDVEQETRNGVVTKEPNWVSRSAQSLFENLRWCMTHNEIPELPILIYTRKSFVDAYCVNGDGSRPLETWINNWYKTLGPKLMGMWIADWRYNQSVTGTIYTGSTLNSTLPLPTSKPAMVSECPAWLWQYGGDIGRVAKVEGVYDDRKIPLAVDVNTTMITTEEFYNRIKFIPRGTTPVEPPPVIPPVNETTETRLTEIENYLSNLPKFVK
jgi:hypothetical protein